MNNYSKIALAGGLLGAGIGLVIGSGATQWNHQTAEMVDRISQAESAPSVVSFQGFDSLPAPVARYFRYVLPEGQPLIRHVRIQQEGTFKLKDKWIPFTATQDFSGGSPGMVWNANMRMNALLGVRVRDAYVQGRGSMQGRIFSIVPIVNEVGKPELDAGALQRYLAEAVWFPTALLPREGMRWDPIDDRRARATLTDHGISVSLEFEFNEVGEITHVFTPGRYREVNGSYELTPWRGTHRQYETRNGVRIPMQGEVEWILPEGAMPYCRLEIQDIEYRS